MESSFQLCQHADHHPSRQQVCGREVSVPICSLKGHRGLGLGGGATDSSPFLFPAACISNPASKQVLFLPASETHMGGALAHTWGSGLQA